MQSYLVPSQTSMNRFYSFRKSWSITHVVLSRSLKTTRAKAINLGNITKYLVKYSLTDQSQLNHNDNEKWERSYYRPQPIACSVPSRNVASWRNIWHVETVTILLYDNAVGNTIPQYLVFKKENKCMTDLRHFMLTPFANKWERNTELFDSSLYFSLESNTRK
jgi:hypothetical protein